jgi:hypothetical protein
MTSPFKQPWHFDKFRKDAEGEYVKIVGRFIGNFEDDINKSRELGVSEQAYNEQEYGHAANPASQGHVEEDAENPYGNPSAKMFAKFNFDKKPGACPTFEKVVNFLEFNTEKKLTQKFNDQFPNHQLMWHIDNLPGNPRSERVIDNPDFKYQHPDKVRFLIMLEDWEPGQVVQFGNIVYTQWQAGTVFAWEWSTLPHATWNGSWHRRPALQLTGTATDRTWEIIANGSIDKTYHI